MPSRNSSIPDALRRNARNLPDDSAFTFFDYDIDPAGYAETLTWSQVYLRALVVAAELRRCGSPGDRVAICAPQGLEYIVGFFGAFEAGLIAVPLSVPQGGAHDERVSAALRDSSPVAILTTSPAIDEVVSCARALPGTPPALIEVDALDLDTSPAFKSTDIPLDRPALLQYTSGSTRSPAGVVVTHKNVVANLRQVFRDYFEDPEGYSAPPGVTPVTWLPFYHDMGLLLGIYAPTWGAHGANIMSPMAFLQKPARYMQALAINTRSFSAAPNFAFELAARRTSDEDMAGLDLGDVYGVISGSERIHAATIRRFFDRFVPFNFPQNALLPSYGLAEATLYVSSKAPGCPPTIARFDYEKLSAGHAKRCDNEAGSELVGQGSPRACTVRIVDPDTRTENPAGRVGEIWVHGDNVANGYWRNPQLTERTFGGRLVDPSQSTPTGPWLRTGDLGVISDGELFIVGRIKDMLIVDGRNHYPDDIEATIQEITGGRAVAISVPGNRTEDLVAIVELKKRGTTAEEAEERLHSVRRKITSAVSRAHSVRVADLVLVPQGSIPITTSGKVRRAACVERYRQDEFARLDTPA